MSGTPPPNLDFTAVMTVVAGVFAGPAMAAYIGPYSVIIIAALVGAAWSLNSERASSTWGALGYMFLITATAVVLTGTVIAVLERYGITTPEASHWLITPVAFGIGWVGRDWPKVLSFASRQVRQRVLDQLRKLGGGNGKR